jgi:acetyl-CoA carboxylase biotin carboxylase subunit
LKTNEEPKRFQRILIANRGEIALRICRACREMDIETICVFSEEDRGSRYLEFADRAICIGPPSPSESYLKSDRIIAAAEVVNADAIHPGYGFLAENADFADKCRTSNIEFIGPSSASMRALGDKASARQLATKNRIPIIPGTDRIEDGDDEQTLATAEKVGYPVMVKASAGGGGRGMRIVRSAKELLPSLNAARQEAKAAFGDSGVYLEKYIEHPRHVEVQVLGDQQGTVIHLFERDCSLQRRYQKLVEETPSPSIDAKTRDGLCRAAVKICKAAKYFGAGTVEFLVDQRGKFYFIEANTRVQVEHPITEMVTGVDIIKAQVNIANGFPLSLAQRDIMPRGAAIECRINAEDPDANFRPAAGLIEVFTPPAGFGVRMDSHAHDGYRVSPRYDSLIGKLIVHQPTRLDAIQCMKRCLREFVIKPGKTTVPLFERIFSHELFVQGKVDTGFIERHILPAKAPTESP